MKRLSSLLTALLLASAPLALAQAGGAYTTIDFPGAISTVAEGIDSAGDIAGYFTSVYENGFVYPHGFLLSGGVYTELDAAGTVAGTIAYGINDVGQIVGTTGSTLGIFVYDIQTQTYTEYAWGSNYGYTAATGINNAGLVVGWATELSPYRYVGFELNGSTFTQINIPNAPTTQLTSINNSGAFIAIASKSGLAISYLGSGDGTFEEVVPPAYHAHAVAINDLNVFAGDYVQPARTRRSNGSGRGFSSPLMNPSNSARMRME
jgi:hypothetical protein